MSLLDAPVSSVRLAALDFESTGARVGQADEPVQIGMAFCLPGLGEPEGFFRSYIRPASSIRASAREVHGIDDDKVKGAPNFASLWPELKQRLGGAVVVAHGVSTEQRFLRAFPFHGFGPWLDTLKIARALMPEISDHSLGKVLSSLELEPEVRRLCPELTWHDALFDAVACLVFLRHVLSLLNQPDMTLGQLSQLDATSYHRIRLMRREASQAGWGDLL
jgi:DNA polymerase-3 subunit epsilon